METKDPAGDLAQKPELHKKWLTFTWKDYSKELRRIGSDVWMMNGLLLIMTKESPVWQNF